MNHQPDNERNDAGYLVAKRMASVAGVVILVMCALLLYDYSRRRAKDPLEEAGFQAMKLALDQQPANETLKAQIRELDLQLRREYFRQRAFTHIGGAMLLLAVAVLLAAAKSAATIRRRLPQPGTSATPVDLEGRWTPIARWAVAALCVALAAVGGLLIVTVRSPIHDDQKLAATVLQPPKASTAAAATRAATTATSFPSSETAPAQRLNAPPSDDVVRAMWPRFRGPDGSGISAYANVPETWDAKAGVNIVWKSPVPLPGNNSPVVWGEQVFLTGADPRRREVYCFDADTGKLAWQQAVPGTPQSTVRTPKVIDDTGHAAPTTATDGRHVFAVFSNGDLAAFDISGKLAWSKSLGIPESSYGHASSLSVDRNLLLVQFDQGSSSAPKSKLFAFDSVTGALTWQADRPVPNSWSTPIVIRVGEQRQVVTSAEPWVIAYDLRDGVEIWRVKCLNTDIGPSPVFASGKVYVANDNSELSAIRADGKGDVTATHIVWKGEDGMPDTCSPLATKEYVFLMASYGTLTCYDAVKGDMLWSEDFEGNFAASPGMAGNRLYLVSKEGKTYIIEPAREGCRRLGEAELGEPCVTSPAFQDGRIYLRGKDHLFCIGSR